MPVGFDERETWSPDERGAEQIKALRRMLRLASARAPAVRRMLEERGVHPEDVRTPDDFAALPVVSRERLVALQLADPPWGGLVPKAARIDRIFISPGPVYEPHLGEADPLWARAYKAAGFGPGDVVLNAFSYHMVAAGLTFHGGLRRVGATVVPSGTSGTQQQVQLLRDLPVTAYTGTPSFLLAILQKAQEMGHDPRRDFRLRRAAFAAEPLLPAVRRRCEEDYGIDAYQMYGATEVGDVAYECREKRGWHLCEEVFVEIVDPATGRRVPPGTLGEVVVTRFNDLFFLFRFGTGDLSRLVAEPCPCGRTAWRLDGIAGRVGEAVKIRGLFVAPSQLRLLQERFPGTSFQALVDREGHEDVLTVRLESPAQPAAPPERTAGKGGAEPSGAPPRFSRTLRAAGIAAGSPGLEDAFREAFREICTIRIDRIERIPPGTLTPEDKPLLDRRPWKED